MTGIFPSDISCDQELSNRASIRINYGYLKEMCYLLTETVMPSDLDLPQLPARSVEATVNMNVLKGYARNRVDGSNH